MPRRYGKKASEKIARTMHEFKRGKLRSGSGGKVTSRQQAVAIGLSQARRGASTSDGRWFGPPGKSTPQHAKMSRIPVITKTPPAQLKREIAKVLAQPTHATRKARAPRVAAYRLQLTPDELRAIEFARGRYSWADMLAAYAAENGAVALTESEMWQWVDDVDDDGAGFPLAAPALKAKLQRFYDSRV